MIEEIHLEEEEEEESFEQDELVEPTDNTDKHGNTDAPEKHANEAAPEQNTKVSAGSSSALEARKTALESAKDAIESEKENATTAAATEAEKHVEPPPKKTKLENQNSHEDLLEARKIFLEETKHGLKVAPRDMDETRPPQKQTTETSKTETVTEAPEPETPKAETPQVSAALPGKEEDMTDDRPKPDAATFARTKTTMAVKLLKAQGFNSLVELANSLTIQVQEVLLALEGTAGFAGVKGDIIHKILEIGGSQESGDSVHVELGKEDMEVESDPEKEEKGKSTKGTYQDQDFEIMFAFSRLALLFSNPSFPVEARVPFFQDTKPLVEALPTIPKPLEDDATVQAKILEASDTFDKMHGNWYTLIPKDWSLLYNYFFLLLHFHVARSSAAYELRWSQRRRMPRKKGLRMLRKVKAKGGGGEKDEDVVGAKGHPLPLLMKTMAIHMRLK